METPRKKKFPDEMKVIEKNLGVNSLTGEQEHHSGESTQWQI